MNSSSQNNHSHHPKSGIESKKILGHQGHQHVHQHGGSGAHLGIAFLLNLVFAIIELVGGLLTGSLAIISDAFHDLGDCLAIGIAWGLEKKSKAQSSHHFSYGLRRLSLVSAFLTGIILVIGSLGVIANAIPKLLNPVMPDTTGMLGLALLGIAVNGFAAFKMMKSTSLNERMVYLHLLEDVLGWLAVLFGALLMKFQPWPIIDPLLAIAIALWVLWNAGKNLKQTLQIFLQGIPFQFELDEVEAWFKNEPGVQDIHHVHIWSLDGERHILTAHVRVQKETSLEEAHQLKTVLKKGLFSEFHIQEATLEIEWPHQICADPQHA